MRLLTKKVYGAFPELDEYDDAQCSRFVEKAKGTSFNQATGVAFLFIIGFGTFAAVAMITRKLLLVTLTGNRVSVGDIAVSAAVILGAIVAPLTALLARDIRLRWRVRYVLRQRGTCLACGYSLIGLALDDQNVVTCPECRERTKVDPAMAELVRSGDHGAVVGMEGPSFTIRNTMYLSYLRKAFRVLFLLFIVMLGGIAIMLGVREVIVRNAAIAASAVQPPIQQIINYSRGIPAPPITSKVTPTPGKFWVNMQKCERYFGGLPTYEYGYNITVGAPVGLRPDQLGKNGSGAKFVLGMSGRDFTFVHSAAGAFEDLYAALANPDKSILRDNGYDEITFEAYQSSIGSNSTNWLIRRAAQLAHERKYDEYLVAIRNGMQLSYVMGLEHDENSYMMRGYIEHNLHDTVQAVISNPAGLPESVLEELAKVYAQEWPVDPPEYPWDGLKLLSKYKVSLHFRDPSVFRFGIYGTPDAGLISVLGRTRGRSIFSYIISPRVSYGSVETSSALLDTALDEYAAAAKIPPANRVIPPGINLSTHYVLQYSAAMLPHILNQQDKLALRRAINTVLIAIERHKLKTGNLPQSLAELHDEIITQIPVNPSNGLPFLYKLNDRGGYILYGQGANGVDDGGLFHNSRSVPLVTTREFPHSQWHTTLFTIGDDECYNDLVEIGIITPADSGNSIPQGPSPEILP